VPASIYSPAVVAAGFWHHDNQALSELHTQVVTSELRPIATLLREDQTIIKELEVEPFTEKDSGILESYLAKIRRDGVPKHADPAAVGAEILAVK
jgi:hypothetical protein